jgi:hypothetical protein
MRRCSIVVVDDGRIIIDALLDFEELVVVVLPSALVNDWDGSRLAQERL